MFVLGDLTCGYIWKDIYIYIYMKDIFAAF